MNILHKLSIAAFCAMSFTACSQSKSSDQEHQIRIEGKVNHPVEGESVVLEKVGQSEISPVDTMIVSRDSTFRYGFKNSEPGFYRINFYNRQYVNLILDDESVKVTADGDKPDGDAKVEGSKDTEYLQEVNNIMQDMQQKINEMNSDYMQARADGKEGKMHEIEEHYKEVEQKHVENIKQKIGEMGNSIAVFYAINFLDADIRNLIFLISLAEKFKKELPNSVYTKQFVAQVDDLRQLAIGMPAPDIALPNPQGDTSSAFLPERPVCHD